MTRTTWLCRTRTADGDVWRTRTWRTHTDGAAPGPTSPWQPIADSCGRDSCGRDVLAQAHARREGVDLAALVAEAAALGEAVSLLDAQLIAPVAPRTIFGIGRNYAAHAAELGNEVPESPLVFLKAPSCLMVSGDPLMLPRGFERIDMESELVVVIGRRARAVRAADAWQYVGGYLLGNDVSCRDLQARDKQWTRAKGFDGFGPVSPFLRLTPPGAALPVDELEICGWLDDRLVQRGSLAAMIFPIPTLIEHLSEHMTLEVGDMIFTGTPAGVSALSPGSRVRIELHGLDLGSLITNVI